MRATDLGFVVYGSDAAAAVTGKIDGDTYDLVNIGPSLVNDEDVGEPLTHPFGDQMGVAVIQPIYDVIAAAFEGVPPGDYPEAASLADLRRARRNLQRAIREAVRRRSPLHAERHTGENE